MGLAAGITAAAAAASAGNAIANSGGGSGGGGSNFGTGIANLIGAFAPPVGNELTGLGITGTDFQPVTGFNLSTPGFTSGLTDTGGTLTGGISQTPNVFNESLPGLMTAFNQIGQGAREAGQSFLQNVTGEPGGLSPLLSPLNQIELARQKAVSDIGGSLAERGLSGSSFGTNAIANANETFGQAASQAALNLSQGLFSNELSSLNAQSNAITSQENLANSELEREIKQLQTEGLLGTNVSDALTRNSSTLAQLAANAAAGRGSALAQGLGNLFPSAGGLISGVGGLISGAGDLFSNIFGSTPSDTIPGTDTTFAQGAAPGPDQIIPM